MRNAIDLTPIDFKQWRAKEWGEYFTASGQVVADIVTMLRILAAN